MQTLALYDLSNNIGDAVSLPLIYKFLLVDGRQSILKIRRYPVSSNSISN